MAPIMYHYKMSKADFLALTLSELDELVKYVQSQQE